MFIHYLSPVSEDSAEFLRSLLSQKVSLSVGSVEECMPEIEVLVAGHVSVELLSRFPNLHTLVIPFAGLPEETRKACLQNRQITVFNLHHNAQITAELAMTLLFSAAKFVIRHDQQLRRGDWSQRYQEPSQSILLAEKNVLVIGYGQIGQRVAAMCKAFGMRVTALQRSLNNAVTVKGIHLEPTHKLDEILPKTHVLMITCPLTDETRGMIGNEQLASMPVGGVLVNVARGEIVDQKSLYDSLAGGHLASAGLDVWYQYPLSEESRTHTYPADYPFHKLDQVIMSPHRGGLVRETEQLRMNHLADLLNRLASGGKLPKPVDVQAGY